MQGDLRPTPIPLRRAGIYFAAGLLWLYYLYTLFSLPDVSRLQHEPPRLTAMMQSVGGELHYEWMPLAQIARTLQRAVIAAEDDQFYRHHGFDWNAIRHAAHINWKRGRFAKGASTITQQVAKNLYLSRSKNPFRKFKEFFIALALERELSKDRILELYLNIAEWAPGVYGAEAAAQHYFKRPARELSGPQAAFLASILPNPAKLGRRGFHLTPRALLILRMM
ncbi:MAG: monofunctional biosynthetic peptidoglycan transglycosylase [Deltaproteobacteria bacterium]|nr:monofunctional biosynthetic peptidoglycan transglycosylase [Deltaproteobacteria bacterium]